ncbi:MAG: hypothetical protein WAU78_07820, partial [Roseiarcus sp.]
GLTPEAARPLLRDAGRAMEDPRAPLPVPPETIVGASFSVGDRVFVAPNHLAAMEEAQRALGLTGPNAEQDLIDRAGGGADGFMTSTGRVVDRAEAATIAKAAAQGVPAGPEGRLRSEDVIAAREAQARAVAAGLPPDYARLAAAMADPAEHGALIDDLIRFAQRGQLEARRVVSEAMRDRALPEASSRLLGGDEAPASRMLETPRQGRAPEPRAAAAEGRSEGASRTAVETQPQAAKPPLNDRIDDLFPEGKAAAGDPLGKVPVERDGKLVLVDRADAGRPAARTEYLAGLIENCIL